MSLDQCVAALVEDGLVPSGRAGSIRSLITSSAQASLHPLVLIAEQGLPHPDKPNQKLDLETLARWLSKESGLEYFRIDPMKIDVEKVTKVVSQEYARQYKILPLEVELEKVLIATSEPFALSWIKDLSQILRKEIKVVVANPGDVGRYLLEFWGVSKSVARATDAKMRSESEKVLNFEQLLKLGEARQLSADDQNVVFIVDWLLQYAFEQRASDIHLEPRRDRSNVRFRIDGDLHLVYQMPTPVMSAVTSRIKILGRMDVAEKRRPQDGRIKTVTPQNREIELRLSTMPTAFGEKCVMRIFDPDVVSMSFEKLGLTRREVKIWRSMVERPNGIVLVTGPTGSGKTTTLYSTLRHLAKPELNVCSIEDPIEMVSPDFNQMQVQSGIGVDFAQGVRTLLRQDPDIIMIGEIRDLETAEMAIQASLTGHLVLSTLHTNDAPSAVVRLMDLGVPDYLLKGTLAGVVAQRLVRTLCKNCKKPGDFDETMWDAQVRGWRIPKPDQVFITVGCDECRKTGYRGRTAIYEMLPFDAEMADRINSDVAGNEFARSAYEKGMRPLRIAAALKVAAGLTTFEEVNRVAPPTLSDR